MNKEKFVNICKWILRIVSALLGIYVLWYYLSGFIIIGLPPWLKQIEILHFVSLAVMLIGLTLFWFNEIFAGLIVFLGLIMFIITENSICGRLITWWVIVDFFMVGVFFILFAVLKKTYLNK